MVETTLLASGSKEKWSGYKWKPSMEKHTATTKALEKGNKAAAKKIKAAAKVARALAKARLTFDKLAGKAATLKNEAKDIVKTQKGNKKGQSKGKKGKKGKKMMTV